MQNNTENKNLLTIGDASEYLGISIDTLRRWERKGRIEPLRSPGGHRYYKKDELDSLFGKKYVRTAETIRPSSTYNPTPKEPLSQTVKEEQHIPPANIPGDGTQTPQVLEERVAPETPQTFTNFPFLERTPGDIKIPEPEKIQVAKKEEFLLTPQEAYYRQQSVSVLTPPEVSPTAVNHQPVSVPSMQIQPVAPIPQHVNPPTPASTYKPAATTTPSNNSTGQNVVINKNLLIYGGIVLGVIFLLFAWYAVYISSQRVLSPIP